MLFSFSIFNLAILTEVTRYSLIKGGFLFLHFEPSASLCSELLSSMNYSKKMEKTELKFKEDRGVLIQSCSARAKNFTNYVFCHPQFSGVIQNIENCCAIRAKFWKFNYWLYKIDYFDNNRHRQTGVKMAQRFSIFWITPLNCGWQNT